jgi:hypothetical protein
MTVDALMSAVAEWLTWYVRPTHVQVVGGRQTRSTRQRGSCTMSNRLLVPAAGGEPVHLGRTLNTAEHTEFCPMVTPDGRYLFFSRRRGNSWSAATAGTCAGSMRGSWNSSGDNGHQAGVRGLPVSWPMTPQGCTPRTASPVLGRDTGLSPQWSRAAGGAARFGATHRGRQDLASGLAHKSRQRGKGPGS